MSYLKIENPGVAMPEAFTLLGATTKRDSGPRTVGKFGSGNKHSVAVCLRNEIPPIVFAGTLKMEFGTKPVTVSDGHRDHDFARVVVKYGGKDSDGKNRSSTEDLGFVLEYGASDWIGVDLALREYVSNAIDRAILEGEHRLAGKWIKEKGYSWTVGECPNAIRDEFEKVLKDYRKTAIDFTNVNVEVVPDNQVRAKAGYTRVFVPMNAEVWKFYENLGKWFLHFSEPDLLDKTILPKANRNLGDRKSAVIYRRGVRVREFESSNTPSLFDYNLEDLELDESRKVDDWRVKHNAGLALRDAGKQELARVFRSFQENTLYWEHQFDTYCLEPSWSDKLEVSETRKKVWKEAFELVCGDDAVLAMKGEGEIAARKGYKVVVAPEAFVKAVGQHYDVRTPEKVLSQDDRDGRSIREATPDAQAAVDFSWNLLELCDMTNGKDKPTVKCFTKIMEGGVQTLGFYREGIVYINTDLVSGNSASMSQQLLVTALEEVVHHTTQATDCSRDFQDFILNMLVKVAR